MCTNILNVNNIWIKFVQDLNTKTFNGPYNCNTSIFEYWLICCIWIRISNMQWTIWTCSMTFTPRYGIVQPISSVGASHIVKTSFVFKLYYLICESDCGAGALSFNIGIILPTLTFQPHWSGGSCSTKLKTVGKISSCYFLHYMMFE